MKLAIFFGDNDFAKTYHQIGKVLYESFKYHNELPSKEVLVYSINVMAQGMAHLFQHQGNLGKVDTTYEMYLRVDESQVFIYDEVDEFLQNNISNGDVVVVDSNLDYPRNNPVYII